MDAFQLDHLIAAGEGQRVEFKQSFARTKEIIRSLAAFANAQGGAVLVGVAPDGSLKGVNIGQRTLEQFADRISARVRPRIFPTIDSIEVDGFPVVVAEVQRSRILVAVDGEYTVRMGRTNQRATRDELEGSRRELLSDRLPDSIASSRPGEHGQFLRRLEELERKMHDAVRR